MVLALMGSVSVCGRVCVWKCLCASVCVDGGVGFSFELLGDFGDLPNIPSGCQMVQKK